MLIGICFIHSKYTKKNKFKFVKTTRKKHDRIKLNWKSNKK